MGRVLYDLAGADAARRFSPHCWRAKMALAHKGLDCQYVAWRFTEKEALAQPNAGQVPVLVDGERVIADSWRIALYLEERYPRNPLFGSETARGEALLIKYWTEKTLHPLILRMVLRDVWAGLHEKDKDYFRESREKRFGMSLEDFVKDREHTRVKFREALEPLRAMLAEQNFVCGSQPGFADYIVFGA
ncbi:MAG: glutathione S-transferase family protein, partial [Burkholderiales bacterium]